MPKKHPKPLFQRISRKYAPKNVIRNNLYNSTNSENILLRNNKTNDADDTNNFQSSHNETIIELERSYSNINPNNLSFKPGINYRNYEYNFDKPKCIEKKPFDVKNEIEIIRTLPKTLELFTSEYNTLFQNYESLSSKFNTQTNIIESQRKQIESLEEANLIFSKEISEKEKRLIEVTNEIEKLRCFEFESKPYIDKLVDSIKIKEEQISRISSENMKLKSENISVNFKKDTQRQELDNLQSRFTEFITEKEFLMKHFEQLHVSLKNTKETLINPFIEKTIKENERLRKEIFSANTEIESIKGIHLSVIVELCSMKQEVNNLKTLYKKCIEKYANHIASLENSVMNCNNNIDCYSNIYTEVLKYQEIIKLFISNIKNVCLSHDPFEYQKKVLNLLLNQKKQYEAKIRKYEYRINELIENEDESEIWDVFGT